MSVNLRDWSHTAAQRGWGGGWPSCSGAVGNLATITFARSGVRVTVHKRIARLVQLLADETERRGYLAKLGQTGAYNCRCIAGTKTPSNHSWGLAIDWNWQSNPYSSNRSHTNPQWMYDLWSRYGFANGSMYDGPWDWMHFEFMGSMADADIMTALALSELTSGGAPVPIIPPAPTTDITWIQEADMALPVLYKGDGVPHSPGGRGRTRWYVMTLQACLAVRGLKAVPAVDGVFGDTTVAAVKELQTRQKITADGVVGPATWPWVLGNDAPDLV